MPAIFFIGDTQKSEQVQVQIAILILREKFTSYKIRSNLKPPAGIDITR